MECVHIRLCPSPPPKNPVWQNVQTLLPHIKNPSSSRKTLVPTGQWGGGEGRGEGGGCIFSPPATSEGMLFSTWWGCLGRVVYIRPRCDHIVLYYPGAVLSVLLISRETSALAERVRPCLGPRPRPQPGPAPAPAPAPPSHTGLQDGHIRATPGRYLGRISHKITVCPATRVKTYVLVPGHNLLPWRSLPNNGLANTRHNPWYTAIQAI